MWFLAGVWAIIAAWLNFAFWIGVIVLLSHLGPKNPPVVEQGHIHVDPEFARLFGGYCVKCGATYDLCWDHIVAKSKGGGTCIANLQRLCRSCNSAKSVDFADYRTDQQKEWSAIR